MIEKTQSSTYECPVVEVIELSTKDGVMQFGSPSGAPNPYNNPFDGGQQNW